jgi:hypothetical protein
VLVAAGRQAATLKFNNWTLTAITAETPYGKWTFSGRGFLEVGFHTLDASTGTQEGIHTPRWRTTEGYLQVTRRERFNWRVESLIGGTSPLTTNQYGRVSGSA